VVSHDLSAGIAMGYGLYDRGSITGRVKIFLHYVLTGSGTHSTSYQVGTRDLSLREKRLGHEADHSPPSDVEVKNSKAIPPLHNMSSLSGA
jgi:hypothetical protein